MKYIFALFLMVLVPAVGHTSQMTCEMIFKTGAEQFGFSAANSKFDFSKLKQIDVTPLPSGKISANLAMDFVREPEGTTFAFFVRFAKDFDAEKFAESIQQLTDLGMEIGARIEPIMVTARASKAVILEAAKLDSVQFIEGARTVRPLGL